LFRSFISRDLVRLFTYTPAPDLLLYWAITHSNNLKCSFSFLRVQLIGWGRVSWVRKRKLEMENKFAKQDKNNNKNFLDSHFMKISDLEEYSWEIGREKKEEGTLECSDEKECLTCLHKNILVYSIFVSKVYFSLAIRYYSFLSIDFFLHQRTSNLHWNCSSERE